MVVEVQLAAKVDVAFIVPCLESCYLLVRELTTKYFVNLILLHCGEVNVHVKPKARVAHNRLRFLHTVGVVLQQFVRVVHVAVSVIKAVQVVHYILTETVKVVGGNVNTSQLLMQSNNLII